MSAELDMSQYTDLFLQEAEEQLEILEAELLKLEEDPSQERMQVIFRAAHTLKGSSRAMGFSHFAQTTHEMENILDLLRGGVLLVNSDIADSLLACVDVLTQMKSSIAAGEGDGAVDCRMLVSGLQGLAGQASAFSSSAAAAPSPAGTMISPAVFEALQLAASEAPVLHAKVRLSDECVMKFVRAFMALNVAQQAGELLATAPEGQDLEEEKFDQEFELVFQTSAPIEQIRASLLEISEVESVELGPWQEPEAAAPKPVITTAAAPSAAPAQESSSASGRKPDTGQTVRVDVARMDDLMNLVGELVVDRSRIAKISRDLSSQMDGPLVDALDETVAHIARITSDLQDQIMKARMMPIEVVFNRFPRVVRDLAQKLGKEVKLELEGGSTELDRSVIEIIGDPLLHIIRNSVDHGLELPDAREQAGKPRQGKVTVRAKHQENHIVIEIIDDGRGIDAQRLRVKAVASGLATEEQAAKMTDREALQFIFASGFSTASEVSEVSGRGVGMDIVRSNLQKLGGIIDLDTKPGEGTWFSLRLPLTLAIIRGLLVRVSGNVYVLPLGSVVETLLLNQAEVQRVNRREVTVIRGMTTPLVRLSDIFRTRKDTERHEGDSYIVIVGLAEQRVGLVVDTLVGEQEVVIKSLSRFCGDVRGVSGATILGDGNVALIADVNSLMTG